MGVLIPLSTGAPTVLIQDFSWFFSVPKEKFRDVNLGRDSVLRRIFSVLLATIRGVKLTTHIHLVSNLRISGAIPSPPTTPLCLQDMDSDSFTATVLHSLDTLYVIDRVVNKMKYTNTRYVWVFSCGEGLRWNLREMLGC
jgi:hypothetical protein